MTTVTFATTDEQDLLRTTVRDLVASRVSSERVREVMATASGVDDTVWKELADMGLVGLLVPEHLGGAGAGFVEVSIVAEELGRRLVPVPYLSSAVLATTAVLGAGDNQQQADLLPAVAAGETRLALAHLDADGRIAAPPGVRATRADDGWRLDGSAGYVVDGASADRLVVAAATDDGVALFLVDADVGGVGREPIEVLDLTRPMATITLDGVEVADTSRLAAGDSDQALDDAVTAGVVALACEQVGGAQHLLETTTAYAKERIQFGRAIGSFQAVKHRLAEMLVEVEAARSAAYHAARALAAGDGGEVAIAAPLAKSYCSEVYERAAGDALQLHGGIAFTWEHDVHLYLKRAKASKQLFGDPRHHRARLGDVLGL